MHACQLQHNWPTWLHTKAMIADAKKTHAYSRQQDVGIMQICNKRWQVLLASHRGCDLPQLLKVVLCLWNLLKKLIGD